MYKTIYIPVDNSDHSNTAVDVGISMAKTFGSKIVPSLGPWPEGGAANSKFPDGAWRREVP